MAQQQHVFISYRSLERAFAVKLADDLEAAGIPVWLDREDIQGGDDWIARLEEGVNTCAALIAVLSPEYNESEYCRAELARARTLNKPIFPVLVKDVPPDKMPLLLQNRQHVDFRRWDQDDAVYQAGLAGLLDLLRKSPAIGPSSAPEPEPPQPKETPPAAIEKLRRLEAAIPEQTKVRTATRLMVKISLPESDGLAAELKEIVRSAAQVHQGDVERTTARIRFPRNAQTGALEAGRVCLDVTSDQFDVSATITDRDACPAGQVPLDVPPDADSRTIVFALRPRAGADAPGPASVSIRLYQDERLVAEKVVTTEIVERPDELSLLEYWQLSTQLLHAITRLEPALESGGVPGGVRIAQQADGSTSPIQIGEVHGNVTIQQPAPAAPLPSTAGRDTGTYAPYYDLGDFSKPLSSRTRPALFRALPVLAVAAAVVIVIIIVVLRVLSPGDHTAADLTATAVTWQQALAAQVQGHAESTGLSGVAASPRGLLLAPSASGPAVWGYGETGATLFALDPATGDPLAIWNPPDSAGDRQAFPLREQISPTFRPGALHYDGDWLWVADSVGQQVVAFDPLTLEERARWALDGQPVALASVQDTLWVALADRGTVAAARFDRATGQHTAFCTREQVAVGEAPTALAIEGRAAIWIAYGRGEGGGVRRIPLQESCTPAQPVTLGGQPATIALQDDTLWAATTDGRLLRLNLEGDLAPQAVDLPDAAIAALATDGAALWLAASDPPRLIRLDPATSRATLTLSLTSPVRAILANGVQVWIATEDSRAIQYTIPDAVHEGTVGIVQTADALWLVDQNRQLCRLTDISLTCETLAISGVPTAVARSGRSDGRAFWLADDSGAIWLIRPEQSEVERLYYTLNAPAMALVEETSVRLWAANIFTGMLATIDLTMPDAAPQDALSRISGSPPDAMAYDGATLWFVHSMQQQIIPVSYSGVVSEDRHRIDVTNVVIDLAADGNYLYAASSGQVMLIDPLRGIITNTISASPRISSLSIGGQGLWAANRSDGFVYRLALPAP